MRLVLSPTTIRQLAVRLDAQGRAKARDPLTRKRFTRRTGAIAAVLAVVIATLVAAAPAAKPQLVGTATAASAVPPNIVLILTDDQRYDTLWAMPIVQSELVAKGIEFTNGFVSNPLCCPSRATILTGQYSHSNGVYTNHPGEPHGGFPAFRDSSTVATWLHDAGYRTGLFGKYLNGYTGTYVPPGWDRWFVTYEGGAYYDYVASTDGKLTKFGSDPSAYGTTVVARQVTNFIRTTDASKPLFVYFAPHAPHEPAVPGPGDGNAFANLQKWRPASYDEADVSDKPEHIRRREHLEPSSVTNIDEFRLDQYRSLLSLDRSVGEIIDALTDTDRLSNTMIVFMSDNGMLWGEHRWHTKVVPYEESIHVPFVIRDDGMISSPRTDPRFVLNVDLAPTFAERAGIAAPETEGRSLIPLLTSEAVEWRTDFLVEHLETKDFGVPTYCGVRTQRYLYVRYVTEEEELYDLSRDPLELRNRAKDPAYLDERRVLQQRLVQLCRPRPPGFSFSFP